MRGGVPIFVAFAPSWCFSKEAVNHLCPSSKPKKGCIRLCDTHNFTQSTTILQPKTSISSLWWKNKLGTNLSRSDLLIWLSSFSHLPEIQDLWIISFFFSFFHEVSHRKVSDGSQYLQISLEGLKVPKIRFLGFWQKSYPFRYAFLFLHELPMFFLYFLSKQHVCKNLILELWSKNLRVSEYLNHNISQKSWGMKLNFWIWLELQKSTKY